MYTSRGKRIRLGHVFWPLLILAAGCYGGYKYSKHKDEPHSKKAYKQALETTQEHLAIAYDDIDSLENVVDCLGQKIVAKDKRIIMLDRALLAANADIDSLKQEIVVKDSTNAVLSDSLKLVKADLEDCQASKKTVAAPVAKKKAAAPVAQKPVEKKPVAKESVVAKPVEKRPVVSEPEVVSKPLVPAQSTTAGNTTVTFESGSQNNTVNINNGIVNNFYGAAVDSIVQQAKARTSGRVFVVTNEVVKCR